MRVGQARRKVSRMTVSRPLQREAAHRIAIAAPDGSAALELEKRLAHLGPSTVSHRGVWVVDIPAAPDPGEIEAVVQRWLGDIGSPTAMLRIDGVPHLVSSPRRPR